MDFKELRKDCIVFINTIEKLEGSRELSLARTKAQEAMMWSGTMLKYLSTTESPYKNNGKREKKEDIEPMFDNTSETLILEKGQIYIVDQLRELIDNRASQVTAFSFDYWSEQVEHGVDEVSFIISDVLEKYKDVT